MALSTSRTLITKTGISTAQVFDMGGISISGGDFNLGNAIKLGNSSGIITSTNFKTGSTNIHSVGVEAAGINVLGGDTPIGAGATIYDDGGVRFVGVVTATSFVGSGANLTGIDATAIQTGTTKIQTSATLISNQISGSGIATVQAGGLDVTGIITATSFSGSGANLTGISQVGGSTGVDFNDNVKIRLGTGNDLEIFHTGTLTKVLNESSRLIISGSASDNIDIMHTQSEYMAKFIPNGAVEIYHNNTKRFETTSAGIDITGDIDATDHIKINTNSKRFMAGASNQARMYHDGSDTYFDNTTNGHLYLFNNVSNKSIIFGTAGTNRAGFDSSGHFSPWANNTYDLGTSGERWRNVYTNDLNLSNEGYTNSVDNTWGNYTIQEGESDLFLINNRNGKKYKFNLTEVS